MNVFASLSNAGGFSHNDGMARVSEVIRTFHMKCESLILNLVGLILAISAAECVLLWDDCVIMKYCDINIASYMHNHISLLG